MYDFLSTMNNIEKRVAEVLHNVNWLIKPHDSHVELVKIEGKKVVVHCVGSCTECEIDCIGVAFKERMPDIKLLRI